MKKTPLDKEFIHISRLALSGRPQDVQAYLRRVIRSRSDDLPDLAESLSALLREAPTRSSPLRKQTDVAVPVDLDSRFQLLKVEETPTLDAPPIYDSGTQKLLDQIIKERNSESALLNAGLEPTRTALFTGPPGVGKTMAARWIAEQTSRPLLILDLAAVMSSFLGRTGSNLRQVLEYAKSLECVLLLDELDAIAKRRDDSSEIGELKRLVTVLIQQIDDWPPSGLLIAATNHEELLDPAIWRRFETVVEFSMPTHSSALRYISQELTGSVEQPTKWAEILAVALQEKSYSELEHLIKRARRMAAIEGTKVERWLLDPISSDNLPKAEKIRLAAELVDSKICSQRQAHELTGVARETIRAHTKAKPKRGRPKKEL